MNINHNTIYTSERTYIPAIISPEAVQPRLSKFHQSLESYRNGSIARKPCLVGCGTPPPENSIPKKKPCRLQCDNLPKAEIERIKYATIKEILDDQDFLNKLSFVSYRIINSSHPQCGNESAKRNRNFCETDFYVKLSNEGIVLTKRDIEDSNFDSLLNVTIPPKIKDAVRIANENGIPVYITLPGMDVLFKVVD